MANHHRKSDSIQRKRIDAKLKRDLEAEKATQISEVSDFPDSAEMEPAPETLPIRVTKTGRRCTLEKLSSGVYQRFLNFIKLGAFDHAAAGALGITPTTFYGWLYRGEQEVHLIQIGKSKKKLSIYGQLYLDVLEARSNARTLAEVQIRKENPALWLKTAARSQPGLPGWSESSDVNISVTQDNPFLVQHEHSHNHTVQPGDDAPVSVGTLGAALSALEELGYIRRTDQGKGLFLEGKVIDVDKEGNVVPEGDVTDADLYGDDITDGVVTGEILPSPSPPKKAPQAPDVP